MRTYLALGDSYTIGEQVPYQDNFPNQTARLLRERGMELSDPLIIATTGWTTDELQAAILEHRLQETFDIVSLLIGVNNQYRGRSVDNFREEFTQLLQQAIHFANGHHDHVFVLSIPDWGLTPFGEGKDRQQVSKEIDAYNEVCEQVAKQYACHYIYITDSTREHAQQADFLVEDHLHPSGKEYAIWAHKLSAEIQEAFQQ